MRIRRSLALPAFLALATSLAYAADTYKIIHTYPHDPKAYTQGLIYLDGHLYESTGLNGRSSLRMVDLETGKVEQQISVDSKYFAEGLTNWGSTLVQLTWLAHTGFVYDRFSFRQLRTFHYDGEGWGLTQDGRSLILSDGTSTLRFLDPETFKVTRSIVVKDQGSPITELNELEYVRGEIYANVWHTDRIARISPATGKVLGWIDLTNLLATDRHPDPEAVLNGIAYDAAHNRLFVTGKLWPEIFEIEVIPSAASAVRAAAGK